MEPWLIALILRPFIALAILGFIALPIKLLVQHYMRPCALKSFLLLPLNDGRNSKR